MRRSWDMASQPFKIKELAKEKEIAALEKGSLKDIQKEKPEKDKHEKEKHEKNEPKEKQEKEKSEKEKHEKEQKEQKESKENKEQKDQKDQKDKEHKQEKPEKDKHEKELKDRHKEGLAKEKVEAREKLPEILQEPSAVSPAVDIAGQAAPDVATDALGMAKIVETKQTVEKPSVAEKSFKVEKDKFEKHEKHEKFEKLEKHEIFENKHLKDIIDTPIVAPPNIPDPGPVEQRLAAVEATLSQLLHFIPENLRPDLTQGALRQETDVAAPKPADPAPSTEENKDKQDKKK
jgi:hypothetical protein